MKKVILAWTLILVIGVAADSWASAAPKHRYNPTTTTQQVDKQSSAADDDEGIEAYSDTTSADTAAVDPVDEDTTSGHHSKYSFDNYDDPFDFFASVFGKGTALFFIILFVILGFLFLVAPFIIIYIIVRYLYRRHRDHMKLAEMAMEKGINVPEKSRPIDKQSDEYLQKRGLRNTFLGAGLGVMFLIWGSDFLAGIGFLVFFYGIGQLVIGFLPDIKKKLGGTDTSAPKDDVENVTD